MEQLSLAAAKEREQGDDPAAFADSVIMYEILSELKEIAARKDGITCSCGSKSYWHGDPQHLRRPCVQKLRREAAHPCGNG